MKISAILAFVAAWLLTCGSAFATHKAWLLKNSGADCQFLTPTAADTVTVGGSLKNTTTSSRWVGCPQTLASRWGSNGNPVFDARTGVDARHAAVYTKHDSSSAAASCFAVMMANDGSNYYSATVADAGTSGVNRITLANQFALSPTVNSNSWASDSGSTLEQNEDLYAVSLMYVCSLPSNTAVLGTKAKLCQLQADCAEGPNDSETDQNEGTSSDMQNVQTNGIECSATQNPSQISKTVDGIKNNGTSANTVFCPIVPPADDTFEHWRKIRYTTVYYSGGGASANSANCVSIGACPSCRVAWTGHDGVAMSEPDLFVKDTTGNYRVTEPSLPLTNVGGEVALGVLCSLPSNVTLEGLTASVSIQGVQGGM